jgi:hypothetical protein
LSPKKLVQTPGLLLILGEFNTMYRQIFTDGRSLPTDPQPNWNGYSTGHWDRDTLVVESNGFRDGLWLDVVAGTPMTDAAKLTERFRRSNFGTLEIEVTVDDDKAYTKPWTAKLIQKLTADTDLLEFVCLENEKELSALEKAEDAVCERDTSCHSMHLSTRRCPDAGLRVLHGFAGYHKGTRQAARDLCDPAEAVSVPVDDYRAIRTAIPDY